MSRLSLILRILFWDGVKPGENWAQTLVRVAGNLFRTFITLSLLFVLYLGMLDWVDALPSETDKALTKIEVDIVHDTESCTTERPIRLSVINNSERPLTNVVVEVSARQPDFSTSALVTGYDSETNRYVSNHRRTFTAIIQPGEGWRLCANFPVRDGLILNELMWAATVKSGEIWTGN